MVISIGSSPLTVRGLNPGAIYSVVVNLFDGNQVVFRELMITANITVMNNLSKIVQDNVLVIRVVTLA